MAEILEMDPRGTEDRVKVKGTEGRAEEGESSRTGGAAPRQGGGPGCNRKAASLAPDVLR